MTGLFIGQARLSLEFGRYRYTSFGSAARPAGMLSVLVNGEGAVSADGAIKDGQPMPQTFSLAHHPRQRRSPIPR